MNAHLADTEAVAQQRVRSRYLGLVTALFLLLLCRPPAAASYAGSTVEVNWGGHLRAIETATAIDDDSIYRFADTGPYYDGQGEVRLKNEIFIGSRWALETHYEAVAAGGDSLENANTLRRMFPGQVVDAGTGSDMISDDRRFFNLTRVLVSEDDHIIYHRLDRLNLTWTPAWGSLCVGRQALTWGNGMIFNPMDLFNPFAPTTVQRDYKTGDDMVLGQIYIGRHEGQMLYAPRRDARSGELRDDHSSYAGKLHLSPDAMETDIMAARHYDDRIVALGATGTLGDAAWRLNTVYTIVNDDYRRDDFLQAVANLDYAWTWGGRNVYGLLEFYYNGLGRGDDYAHALTEPYIVDRLSRGDLYTLGRYYLAGLLQCELHPLLRNDWTVIVNLEDPSGLVLPQLLWDVTTNTQIIFGAQLHWGSGDTEYGGFETSLSNRTVRITPRDQIYLWVTYSF